MRMLAFPSRLKGGTFPFKPPWVAQHGQFNRFIERGSQRQTIVNLMFINMLVVYSLPILLKREESTRFEWKSGEGQIHGCETDLLK